MMLWKGLVHVGPRPARAAAAAATVRQLRRIQGIAGQGSGEVLETGPCGPGRSRTGHVLLDDEIGEAGGGGVQPIRRGHAARLERVAAGLTQSHETVVTVHVGEVEPCDPLHRGQCRVEGIRERAGQGATSALLGAR